MEELKPYIVEFDKNDVMKLKVYFSDWAVRGNNWWPIIVITHNKCTFFANNRIWKAWARKSDIFLHPKGQRQEILVSEFILHYGRLNLAFLTPKKSEKVIQQMGLTTTEAVKVFKYGKNNNRYWDEAKLHKQVVEKALSIAKTFYPGYSLCFLFDNITSHFIYIKDILQIKDINKESGRKQRILHNRWYDHKDVQITHPMTFLNGKSKIT